MEVNGGNARLTEQSEVNGGDGDKWRRMEAEWFRAG